MSGDFWGSQEGCQGPFRPSGLLQQAGDHSLVVVCGVFLVVASLVCFDQASSLVQSVGPVVSESRVPGVPLRGEGSCGGGGAPRDSAGSGATP